MKTPKPKFMLIILLLCVFGFNSYGQQTEKKLVLVCDTEELKNNKAPYTVCRFEGQTESDTREYTVEGKVGDTFIWEGKSTNQVDDLDITKIKYEKGTKIFEKDSIEGTRTVRAVARNNTKNKPDFKYKIYFRINGTGKPYKIDPKLTIRD